MNSKIISGIVPPLVTPLLSRDRLDRQGLENLIEHVLSGGVNGLFLLGTTGEGPSLSHALRREVIELTCCQVAGRVPIVVAVTDTSLSELLEIAHFSAEQGATGVVLAPPYYFEAGQAEVIEFVEDVLAELRVPLVLYNMPALTKIKFDLTTVRHLAQHENIVGIKDSSGDMNYFHQLLRVARPDWSVMMGSEVLMAEAVLFGADGGVCGGANVAPSLFVELFEAARDLDFQEVRKLQSRLLEFGERLYSLGRFDSSGLKGIKGALSCLGIGNGNTAEPFHSFDDCELAELRKALQELGLLPLTQVKQLQLRDSTPFPYYSSTSTFASQLP